MVESPVYIRVISISPSILRTPEDKDFVDRFPDYFKLREDEEYLSLWRSDHLKKDHVAVAWAAYAKSRQSKFDYLELPNELFEKAGIAVFQSPDREAFNCIQDAHYGFVPTEVQLRELGKLVQQMLCTSSISLKRITKGSLKEKILDLDKTCRDNHSNKKYDLNLARDWAQTLLTKELV